MAELALAHDRLSAHSAPESISRSRSASSSACSWRSVLLQRLVAARGRGLALQVADLLVDFVAHVLRRSRFSRVSAMRALGLLAALLVARDAGGLLDERAHVLGACASMTREIMPCSMIA